LRLSQHRPPRSLLFLLAAVMLIGAAWALFVPPFQSPDENSHFAYAQTLAERFELPGNGKGLYSSTEQQLAMSWSNADQAAQVTATKPEWSKQAYEHWRTLEDDIGDAGREDGGGPNPASTNPPLYYLYVSPAYLAAEKGDIFDRLYLMRLSSMLLLLVTVTATWLLAGELFERDRRLQFAAASVAGLQPMVSVLSASVNPDALLIALFSIAFWLGVRILKRGLTAAQAIAFFGVAGLAVTVKATGYALFPAALFVLCVAAVRRKRAGHGVAAIACAGLLAFAVPTGAWLATAAALDRPAVNRIATGSEKAAPTLTSFKPRDLGSYLWQFYLPKLPFQRRFGGMPDLPAYDIWLKQGWAAFGWLEVKFPNWVYGVLAGLSLTALTAAGAAVARRRRSIDLAIAGFIAVAFIVLLAGLHWTEFRTLVGGSGPFNQGRYLLPLISLGGAAVAGAITLLPLRRRAAAVGLLAGGLFALELFSLAIVGSRFYA
jgi:4-amino-4-deoxy-L-arabinose transferase-like glycosyltransferase